MKLVSVVRKILIILGAIGVLILMVAYLAGSFNQRVAPGKVKPEQRHLEDGQKTWMVHQVVDTERAEFTGTLKAEQRTEVSPRIMAMILDIAVRAGDEVKKGQVLVKLDDREYRAKLEQARQEIEAAEADLTNAEQQYNRIKTLYDQEVASEQELDSARAAFKVAEAKLRQAREAKSAAETVLSYTVIHSPTDGVVVDKLGDEGDTASPGKPILTIYDPKGLRLEAPVPETIASSVEVGQTLKFYVDTLDRDEPLEGKVSEKVASADPASRTVTIKIDVPSVKGLLEGAFGRVIIPTRKRIRLCLAQSAVREKGQLRFVDVVTTGGALERRQVQLSAHRNLGRVEVLSGVDPGEKVALYGPAPPPVPDNVRLFVDEGVYE